MNIYFSGFNKLISILTELGLGITLKTANLNQGEVITQQTILSDQNPE